MTHLAFTPGSKRQQLWLAMTASKLRESPFCSPSGLPMVRAVMCANSCTASRCSLAPSPCRCAVLHLGSYQLVEPVRPSRRFLISFRRDAGPRKGVWWRPLGSWLCLRLQTHTCCPGRRAVPCDPAHGVWRAVLEVWHHVLRCRLQRYPRGVIQ